MVNRPLNKILHVLPTFCKGGGEKLVHDLCNHQVQSIAVVDILCVYKNTYQGQFLTDTLNPLVKINYIISKEQDKSLGNSFLEILSKIFLYLKIVLWFFGNKKRIYEYDIVHVHMTYGAFFGTLVYLFRPRTSKLKVIETNHTDSSSIRGMLKVFFSINRKFRDGIIFELKKDDYTEHVRKGDRPRSTFIPIGTSYVAPMNELNIVPKHQDIFVIGQVGRIHFYDRRTDLYIKLIKELNLLTNINFIFHVYGDGPDRANFEKMVESYNLSDRFRFFGYTDDIGSAFKSVDLYVTINVGENCGVAGLQAIWSKVPTVAIQVDETYTSNGLKDNIPNAVDLKALASYMNSLMLEKQNLQVLQKRQFEYISQNHSIENYCSKTEVFYKRLFELKV